MCRQKKTGTNLSVATCIFYPDNVDLCDYNLLFYKHSSFRHGAYSIFTDFYF